jgi:hypothetical protein
MNLVPECGYMFPFHAQVLLCGKYKKVSATISPIILWTQHTFQFDASLCPHWIEAYVLRLQEKSLNDDPGNDKFGPKSHFFLVKGLDF